MAKEKKASTIVNIDGSQGTQTFDSSKFKDAYEGWKTECESAKGDALGITSGKSLLDLVASHGELEVSRNKENEIPDGGHNIIKLLDDMLEMNEAITEQDKKEVTKVYTKLKNMRDTKDDPRNIIFTIPNWAEVNRSNADYDEDEDVVEVYGHYRTDDYVKYRNLKAKIFGGKEEPIKAVSSDWYNTAENQAEPPMWQAFFAGSGDLYEVKKMLIRKKVLIQNGLLHVLSEVVKALEEDVSFEHLKLKIVDTGKGTTAAELMQIDVVNDYVAEMIGDKNNAGWGMNKTTGMFRDSHAHGRLKTFAFIDIGLKDSKTVKRIADYDKFIGEVKGISLNITRRQMKNLAILSGHCKRTPGKETVFMPGLVEKKEVPKKKPAPKKKNTKVKKSWESVLAW